VEFVMPFMKLATLGDGPVICGRNVPEPQNTP
jgi:hypothetical protein